MQATSLCIYSEDAAVHDPRWLGMLALSEKGRVIFFPGFGFRPEWVRSGNNQTGLKEHALAVDHLTLERNGGEWHFTTVGSHQHHAGGLAKSVGEYISWFGMTVANGDALAAVWQRTLIRTAIPSVDVDRRYRMLKPLAEGMPQHLITLDERTPPSYASTHFGFVVSSADAEPYVGSSFDLPFGSPFLAAPLPDLRGLPTRYHRVPLGEFAVHVVAAKLPVAMKIPIAFTTRR